MTDAERLTRLEESIAHLQRHVGEQDKVMLALAEDVSRLRRDLAGLRERVPTAPPAEIPAGDERPPHY